MTFALTAHRLYWLLLPIALFTVYRATVAAREETGHLKGLGALVALTVGAGVFLLTLCLILAINGLAA